MPVDPQAQLDLYFHPFSSYSQKVLIALYENATPFTPRPLGPEHASHGAEMHALWPLDRFPVLRAGGRTIFEATCIIEYLDRHHRGGVQMIPDEPDAALEARMRDRVFDNYVMTPMQAIVFDRRRPENVRDPHSVAEARELLERTYAWLDGEMAHRPWATGDTFGLADCAAAPSLFYADWVHPIDARFPHVAAYRARLNARPSIARAIEGGRPYRRLFPGGAPDRD